MKALLIAALTLSSLGCQQPSTPIAADAPQPHFTPPPPRDTYPLRVRFDSIQWKGGFLRARYAEGNGIITGTNYKATFEFMVENCGEFSVPEPPATIRGRENNGKLVIVVNNPDQTFKECAMSVTAHPF